jgi:LysM repeat protein
VVTPRAATLGIVTACIAGCASAPVAHVDPDAPGSQASIGDVSDQSPLTPPAWDLDSSASVFASWLRAHSPPGSLVVPAREGAPARVVHTVAPGDTPSSIATAYLDVTDVYDAKELASAITAPLTPGAELEIPHLVTAAYKEPDDDRLGWPADKVLRGAFVTGAYAAILWVDTLDKIAAHGLNAVVLDG